MDHIACQLDVEYDWTYASTQPDLHALYEKAKRMQWDASTALPWSTPVDLAKSPYPEYLTPLYGSDIYARMTAREKERLQVELGAWLASQFLHGENGALLAASQLVLCVPDRDSKAYAATQVVDEARHVEVYERYVREKVGIRYDVNPHLKRLLDLTLTDSRWDVKLLGMQIMVEGLALAAFGAIRQSTGEPLLRALTTAVMRDEARHVAYGLSALRDAYSGMTEADRFEREDFVYEAAVLMRDRFRFEEVYQKLGLPAAECVRIGEASAGRAIFVQMLFSKIVPAIKRIGLLSERQRVRFHALGILELEDAPDPFASLDEAVSAEASS
jgi:hypothetical protein